MSYEGMIPPPTPPVDVKFDSTITEDDYSRVQFLLLPGGVRVEIELGSYREFNATGKKRTFVAQHCPPKYTIAGAVDDVIAMWFLNEDEPTSEPSTE